MKKFKDMNEDEQYKHLLRLSYEPHGILATYKMGCPCIPCKNAWNDYKTELRRKNKKLTKCKYCNRVTKKDKKSVYCLKCAAYVRSNWYSRQDFDKTAGEWFKVTPEEFFRLRQLPAYWFDRSLVFIEDNKRYYLDSEKREVRMWLANKHFKTNRQDDDTARQRIEEIISWESEESEEENNEV